MVRPSPRLRRHFVRVRVQVLNVAQLDAQYGMARLLVAEPWRESLG